jgi:hypothetical protein
VQNTTGAVLRCAGDLRILQPGLQPFEVARQKAQKDTLSQLEPCVSIDDYLPTPAAPPQTRRTASPGWLAAAKLLNLSESARHSKGDSTKPTHASEPVAVEPNQLGQRKSSKHKRSLEYCDDAGFKPIKTEPYASTAVVRVECERKEALGMLAPETPSPTADSLCHRPVAMTPYQLGSFVAGEDRWAMNKAALQPLPTAATHWSMADRADHSYAESPLKHHAQGSLRNDGLADRSNDHAGVSCADVRHLVSSKPCTDVALVRIPCTFP